MQSTSNSTVVGVFEHSADAERALGDLRDAGFTEAQIGVTRRSETAPRNEGSDDASEVGTGAAAGAVTGLGLGALAGLGVLSGMVPVIGPAIAGGTLGVILSNAAAGAGVAGLIGALVGAGIPEHEAAYYQEEVVAGRTVLTVDAGTRAREAGDILRRNGAYDATNRPSVGNAAVAESRRVDVPVEREELSSGDEVIVRDEPRDDYEERIL